MWENSDFDFYFENNKITHNVEFSKGSCISELSNIRLSVSLSEQFAFSFYSSTLLRLRVLLHQHQLSLNSRACLHPNQSSGKGPKLPCFSVLFTAWGVPSVSLCGIAGYYFEYDCVSDLGFWFSVGLTIVSVWLVVGLLFRFGFP